ncbi:ATP-binding protein [Paucilactobacillus wasatchensis]|uniref:YhaN AAA domain-containing protein n=1 Tax=Paucilactobacillus wasatchensis TaxID=1335616 RepID=A0A0D1A8B8_9LACO|nr:AAA family ATPase [Paucilactobacillus wasatchensis]KIS04060.1 hypothetical protein WDC_0262 [Paucilactobacillus wasatchensis]
MKIQQIQIDGFGKWQDQQFDIDPQFQIIYGKNEAGKTTLSHFITSILFGFANGHQQYQQYLPKNGAAYGGQLTIEAENLIYRLQRVKGKNGGPLTISDEQGQQLPATKLTEILGPIDQQLYDSIFSFSQIDLTQIFQLTGQNLADYLRQMGAVGSSQWLDLIKEHRKNADEIYKPRGSKPQLNQRLKEYKALNIKVQQAAGRYDHYQTLLAQVNSASEKLTKNRAHLKQVQLELEHLQGLKRLMPIFLKLKATTTNQVELTNEDIAQVQQLQADLTQINSQVQNLTQQLTDVQQNNQLTGQQQFYFDHVSQFERVAQLMPQLKLRLEQDERQNEQLDAWTVAQQQILARYNVNRLPAATSDEQIAILEQLQGQQRELQTKLESLTQSQMRTKPTTVQSTWWGYGVAVVSLIALLIVPNLFVKIILVLVLLGSLVSNVWVNRGAKDQQQVNNQEKLQTVKAYLDSVEQKLTNWGKQNKVTAFRQEQWLSMQGDLRRFADLEKQINQVGEQQTQTKIKEAEFKQALAFAREWVQLDGSVNELIERVEQFIAKQAGAKDAWQSQQQRFSILAKQLDDTKQHQIVKQQQKTAIYARLKITNDADFKATHQQFLIATADQEKAAALSSQVSAEQQQELAAFTDEDDLANQLIAKQATVDEVKKTIDDAFEMQTSVQLEINQMAKSGTLSALRQQQANLQATINQLVFNWLSEQLTSAWINQALDLASKGRFPQIIKKANKYFATLTGQHYGKIEVDDEKITVVDQDGDSFEVGELSQGTAEQLYVALRFGFAVVMSDTINLPLLIDDGFVNFDNSRKTAVLNVIQQISAENQVIYFTANDHILTQMTETSILNLDKE